MKTTFMRLLLTVVFIIGIYWVTAAKHTSFTKDGVAVDTPMMTVADTIDINKFPVPDASVERLFYLQRDPNTNTIIYALKLEKDGSLDTDEPVHPYWKLYSKQSQCVELTFIQRNFAYGVTAKPLGKDKYDIRIVSYNKIPFTLMKGTDGKYHIFVPILKRQAILSRVFVRINGGSLWSPNVVYVELKGTDTETGKEIAERLKP